MKYNSRGLVELSANYSEAQAGCSAFNGAAPQTFTTYDPLGNVATVTNPTDASTPASSRSEDHSTLTVTSIDEDSHKKTSTQNGLGETVQVQEFTGTGTVLDPYVVYATTAYNYDRLGNLLTTTDNEGNQTTMTYDMINRKTSLVDRDTGTWTYQYDAQGNLTYQSQGSRGTWLTYDALGRLTSKNGFSMYATYTYDSYDPAAPPAAACDPNISTPNTAIGQMTKMYGYDAWPPITTGLPPKLVPRIMTVLR